MKNFWAGKNFLFMFLGVIFGVLLIRFTGGQFIGQPALPNPKSNDGPEYNHRQPVSPDLTKLYPKLITRQGTPKSTALALTFDDGPDIKYTPKILDVLKKYNIKATFFVVGTQIQKYPAVFRRLIREGHEVGSHGYQHIRVANQPDATIQYLLNKNRDLIRKFTKQPQITYRPTYGALDPHSIEIIGKNSYKIVLWTIDSLDWRGIKKQDVVSNVVSKINHGYIILQHSAADDPKENLTGSIDALPDIIKTAKSKGYHFVTVSEILKEAGK